MARSKQSPPKSEDTIPETETRRTLKDVLLGIRAKRGVLTPEIVRDEARAEDSPIHAYVFNVPPDQAAEEYYLERSHELIRKVKVNYVNQADQTVRRVRLLHAVPAEDTAYVYEPLTVILGSPDKFAQVRREAIRRLRDAETAVEDFDALAADTDAAANSAAAREAVKEAVAALATAAD